MSLKVLGSGETINTPSISKMLLEDMIDDVMIAEDKRLEGTFTDKMSYKCSVCKASGIDPDEAVPCYACEGTGKDYEIIYGRDSSGELYAYTQQYGMDFFKEYCKACREAEAEQTLTQRANRFMVRAFSLPAVIDMELQARGFTPQDIRGGGERNKEVAKMVQREWPALMTTNYMI